MRVPRKGCRKEGSFHYYPLSSHSKCLLPLLTESSGIFRNGEKVEGRTGTALPTHKLSMETKDLTGFLPENTYIFGEVPSLLEISVSLTVMSTPP